MKYLLIFISIGIFILAAGCAHAPAPLQVQCLDPLRKDSIKGPIITDGDSILFYDSKGHLTKVKAGTCGVQAEGR